jgi:hypothetical protein
MNWMGPRSGGTGVLDAPSAMTHLRAHRQEAKVLRSWLPAFRHRRPEPVAIVLPAGPSFAEIASEAMSSFRGQAIGMRCGSGRDAAARVRVVCSSAAHITDPVQLEVWVLLGEVDEERIPPRWDPTQVLADVHLTAWALQLRSAALGHLMALDWPGISSVVVRLDAADRVERRGGWGYVVATAA